MRTDDMVPKQLESETQCQPARTTNILKGFFAALVGALLIAGMVPAQASAATATITIDRINGEFVVQGRGFPANATGTVDATINRLKGSKPFHTNGRGYFWASFVKFTAGGYATAEARKNPVKANATKSNLPAANGSTAPASSGTTSTTAPPASSGETTVTAAARATTTTTAKPATTTTTAKPVTTTAPGSTFGTNTTGRSLVFSDDFNGALDKGKWGVYEGKGNAGIGWRKASAVTTGNGELRIKGSGDVGGGLASNYKGTYGRYEVRSRLDGGQGYNTATLLWPGSERWPVDGELDISEIFSGDNGRSGSFAHWGSNNSQSGKFTNIDTSQWHTYAVDWTSTKATFFIDGKEVFAVTGAGVPHNNHFLGIQLDVSSKTPRTDGRTFHIDWVKVYK